MRLVNRFVSDRRGTAAILFGLTLVPLVGVAGAAVDYGRALSLKADMQQAADATALHLAREALLGRSHDVDAVFLAALAGSGVAGGAVTVDDDFIDPETVRVTAATTIETTFATLIMPTLDISVAATATASQDAGAPGEDANGTPMRYRIEQANLSVEAADYNELRLYCYHEDLNARRSVYVPRPGLDPQKTALDLSDFTRAPEFLKIADNTNAGVARPPQTFEVYCGAGEQLSYQLINIRDARTSPSKRATNARFDHFTDTTVNRDGVVSYNTARRDLVETILCDTRAACDPSHPDAVVPGNAQRNRTPAVNTQVCRPGQFLYFGWEDRPPHIGEWTDQDYDDIRVVTTCGVSDPVVAGEDEEPTAGDILVRLVQ